MSNPNLSSIFYDYLSDLIGTEDVVNSRRRIFTAYDHVNSNKGCTCISSGSKAEGLDLEGSDLDVMFVLNYYQVYERKNDSVTQLSGLFPFVMDTTDCKPGFTQLKRYINMSRGGLERCCENKAGESYLSSSVLKDDFSLKGKFPVLIHGPCLSDSEGTLDVAICLRCNKWISQANLWKVRSRHSWASDNVIDAILQFGILFVPIGCKSSPNIDFEWRISFSHAEKLLIYSFNHVQLLCYALLKILFKDIIKKKTGDLLCSYFLKTVMFWICEETKPLQWKPKEIMYCFMSCLRRLIYCVRYRTCAHYFILENDLFAERFDKQQHSLLLSSLNQLQSLGWTCLLHTNTLMSFRGVLVPDPSTLIHKYDQASYLNSLLNSRINNMICRNSIQRLPYIVNMCMRSNKNDFLIDKLSDISRYNSHNSLEECSSNKESYNVYRKRLCHLVIGLNHDAVSGWLTLASFFYVNKRYQTCQEILSNCLSKCTRDKILMSASNETQTRFNVLQKELGLNHISLIRQCVIDYVRFTPSSPILPEELSVLDDGEILQFPPVVFGLFINILCDNHLDNQRAKYKSLRALENVVLNLYFIVNENQLEIAHMLLSIAYSL